MTPDIALRHMEGPQIDEESPAVIDLDRLFTILFSGGVTGAGLLTFLIIMLSRGQLWTKSAHDEIVKSKDDQLTEVVKTKDDRIAELELDRDQWRVSSETERARGDTLQVRVSEEVVPLLKVTNGLLESIRTVGGEQNGRTAD